jgi:hypothetical protein
LNGFSDGVKKVFQYEKIREGNADPSKESPQKFEAARQIK